MKKIALAAITALSLTSGVTFAEDLDSRSFFEGSKGSIVFRGQVTSAPCSIAPVTEVYLGSTSTETFKEAGASSRWVTSSIEFYDCDLKVGTGGQGAQSVELTVEPGLALTNELWANTGGDAANVGLELHVNNQIVKPEGTASLTGIAIHSNRTLNIPVKARLKSAGSVTAGSFNTVVNFVANYK